MGWLQQVYLGAPSLFGCFVALNFGAYIAPECTADIHHQIVHHVNVISVANHLLILLIQIIFIELFFCHKWNKLQQLNSALIF